MQSLQRNPRLFSPLHWRFVSCLRRRSPPLIRISAVPRSPIRPVPPLAAHPQQSLPSQIPIPTNPRLLLNIKEKKRKHRGNNIIEISRACTIYFLNYICSTPFVGIFRECILRSSTHRALENPEHIRYLHAKTHILLLPLASKQNMRQLINLLL